MAPALTYDTAPSPPVASAANEKATSPSHLSDTASYQALASKHITKAVGRLREHVFASGRGLNVTTTDGEELLDFTSGIGVTSLGHAHPAVTAAIVEQAQSIVHVQCAIALSKPYVELIHNLIPMMPDAQLDSFFLWNSGSEAVEAAIKVVRTHTRRNNIIVMQGAYHGRTSGATALTRSKTSFFAGTGPLMVSSEENFVVVLRCVNMSRSDEHH
jgi:4-aminobutyrate aminotransferase